MRLAKQRVSRKLDDVAHDGEAADALSLHKAATVLEGQASALLASIARFRRPRWEVQAIESYRDFFAFVAEWSAEIAVARRKQSSWQLMQRAA